jgi:exodeoxyribonuclease III
VKLVSWNANGIRSLARKGLASFLAEEAPDIFCVQETRAWPEQLEPQVLRPPGYSSWWSTAEKKGYSGVCIYSRIEPESVEEGLGQARFDSEGRILTAHFPSFSLVNAYFPNGQRDHARVPFKLDFCHAFLDHCRRLRRQGRKLVLCGDFNTAHREIDLKRPRDNRKTTGFLPEERAWIDELLEADFVDIFRRFHPDEPEHYTWWSNRQGVRQRNVGWRIDYFFTDQALDDRIIAAYLRPQTLGSDHCPTVLELSPDE